jgi:ribonuclease HI
MMMITAAGSNEIQVYFYGLCQPYNPSGIACYAFVILAKKGHEQKQQQHSEYGLAAEPFAENATNNMAEYIGIIKTLEWLLEKTITTIIKRS